jgi:hypothetical protein
MTMLVAHVIWDAMPGSHQLGFHMLLSADESHPDVRLVCYVVMLTCELMVCYAEVPPAVCHSPVHSVTEQNAGCGCPPSMSSTRCCLLGSAQHPIHAESSHHKPYQVSKPLQTPYLLRNPVTSCACSVRPHGPLSRRHLGCYQTIVCAVCVVTTAAGQRPSFRDEHTANFLKTGTLSQNAPLKFPCSA